MTNKEVFTNFSDEQWAIEEMLVSMLMDFWEGYNNYE